MTDKQMLGERYEIGTALGSGGMATVYAGRDSLLDRKVAIKMLAEKYAGDDSFVERFQREARAAAGLNHRNIVSVFDTGDTDGRHYIVMELVDGETLGDILKREGPLSPARVARIGSSVARALQAAHDQGLVHRDVKPGNVMITPAGDVKVMDFGIARAQTDETLTQTGMVLGTASYLSPEQSRGDTVDHRSDVYSLGCVLYEMLSGQPPFSATSPISVAYQHVNEQPRAISELNPSVTPPLEAVVMQALAKEPAARFSSAAELGDALIAAAGGEPTDPMLEPTAVMPASDLTEPPRRRLWIPAGIALIVLIVAALVALGGSDQRGGQRRANDAARNEQTTKPSPSPSPSPSPEETETELVDVASAVSKLNDDVSSALASGQIDEHVSDKIVDEVGKAVDEYSKPDLEKAVEHLDHAAEEIEKGLEKGEVSSSDVASVLLADLTGIATAMEAGASSAEESSDEDSGGGPPGLAKGHDKHEDED